MRSVFSWLRCHQNPKTEISTSAEFNRLYALARAPIFLAFESLNAIGKHVEKKANIVGHSVSRVGRPQTFGILLMDKILHHQGWWLSHYLQGFNHPRWCRISSINSMLRVSPPKNCKISDIPGVKCWLLADKLSPPRFLSNLFFGTGLLQQASWLHSTATGQIPHLVRIFLL